MPDWIEYLRADIVERQLAEARAGREADRRVEAALERDLMDARVQRMGAEAERDRLAADLAQERMSRDEKIAQALAKADYEAERAGNIENDNDRLAAEVARLEVALRMPDVERRLWHISDFLGRHGHFNRRDICEAFNVSVPQASLDIKRWLAAHPCAATYNPRSRRYEIAASSGEAESGSQRASLVRGITARCEHGEVDFEDCPKCREDALRTRSDRETGRG